VQTTVVSIAGLAIIIARKTVPAASPSSQETPCLCVHVVVLTPVLHHWKWIENKPIGYDVTALPVIASRFSPLCNFPLVHAFTNFQVNSLFLPYLTWILWFFCIVSKTSVHIVIVNDAITASYSACVVVMFLTWQTGEWLPSTFAVWTTIISGHFVVITACKVVIRCPSCWVGGVTLLWKNCSVVHIRTNSYLGPAVEMIDFKFSANFFHQHVYEFKAIKFYANWSTK
jgi:hypothetical protein